MHSSFRLLTKRRFLPLFATQFLGALNDNLFRTAMVMLVIFEMYHSPAREEAFSAIAGGLFVLPFFLLSATAGQLADGHDKSRIIRIVKNAEIGIMVFGAIGLLTQSIALMLAALFAMGVHSTFFGPIKYAILPQHLRDHEVLGGTGLVEAGTNLAVLAGIIIGGLVPSRTAALLVLAVALVGRLVGQQIPAAPPALSEQARPIDHHFVRASLKLVGGTMHVPRLFLAIMAISFFWAEGAVLLAEFPPLVKNVLTASQDVATLFLAIFSVGVALGSVTVNRLLQGTVSARFSPFSAIAMGLFVCHLYFTLRAWPATPNDLVSIGAFLHERHADLVMIDLFGVAFFGGMFVVPLYAFLTTTVTKANCAKTVAANNIVNSGGMVIASLAAAGLAKMNVSVAEILLLVAVGSIGAAALSWKLHLACD